MYLIRLWTDNMEFCHWRVKKHDLLYGARMRNNRSFLATLEDGRQIIISPASTQTIIIEEIPDEE